MCYIPGVLKVSLCFTVILLLFVKTLGSLLALALHNTYILVNTAIRQIRKNALLHFLGCALLFICKNVYEQWGYILPYVMTDENMQRISPPCSVFLIRNTPCLEAKVIDSILAQWQENIWFAEGRHLIFIEHPLDFMRIYVSDYKCSPVKRLL